MAGRFLGRGIRGEGRARPLFRMPRSLKFTREGKWYTAVLFLVGVAAINTGNNLLYLIVATLLSFIVISGVMSESTLRGLRVRRTLPRRFYKGSPVNVRYRITNTKRFLPSFSFVIREEREEGFTQGPVYVLKLRAGSEETMASRHVFSRRGRRTQTGIKVTTRFPFGLFLKGKVEDALDEIIVYPDVRAKGKALPEPSYRGGGAQASALRGEGTQIYNLRDYTPQDDSRLIYWKSAARTSKLLVKEFERETERKALVVFENYSGAGEEVFEALVDEAASIADGLIKRGYAVGLKTLSEEMAPRLGTGQLYAILETLALIGPSGKAGPPGIKVIYI